ncbi:PucR family transcriptional regulator [Nocardia sp. NPDC003979]
MPNRPRPPQDATQTGRRISDDLPGAAVIAGQIMDRFVITSPLPTTVPTTMLRRDVLAMVRACLAVAADVLDGVDPRKSLAEVRTCAVDWAHAGASVDAMHHAMHEGLAWTFDHVAARARADDGSMIVAGRAFVEIANRLAVAISQGYLTETLDGRDESVDALVSAVMAGTATSAMARAHGLRLSANYLVFALEIAPHVDESDSRLDRRIIAGRKVRRVRTEVTRWCGNNVLMLLTASGGTLLVPASQLDTADAERFVDAISGAAQAPVRATFLPATIDSVPATIEHVDAMLRLMHRMRRGGLHLFGDLAVEYQLTRPGAARDHLAAVLDPLNPQPVLLETLQTHLSTRAARLRTAKALHVHPNTIDYRLERIAEVIGLDPRKPDDLWRLRSAMVARLAGDIDEELEHPEQPAVAAKAC